MKSAVKCLSYAIILSGVIFAILGLSEAYFNSRAEIKNSRLDSGTLEIDLKDAFSSEIALKFNVASIEPYKKETSYAKIKNSGSLPLVWKFSLDRDQETCSGGNKCLSDILQGELYAELTLLDYLRQAKKAETNEDYQKALDEFVKQVKLSEQLGLMDQETKDKLILKSRIIR